MFQLSLSTLLTSSTTPGAGLIPALSGDFAATLAGIAEASPQPVPAAAAPPTPRQGDAEAGKSLPTAAAAVPTLDSALAWLAEGDGAGAAPIAPAAEPATADGRDPVGRADSPLPQPTRRPGVVVAASAPNPTVRVVAPAFVEKAAIRIAATRVARPQPASVLAAAAPSATAPPAPAPPVGDSHAGLDARAPSLPTSDRADTTLVAETARPAHATPLLGQTCAATPRVETADRIPAPAATPRAAIALPAAAPAPRVPPAPAQGQVSHDIALNAKIAIVAPRSLVPTPQGHHAAASPESLPPDCAATGISLAYEDGSAATATVAPESVPARVTHDDKKAVVGPEKTRKAEPAEGAPQPSAPPAAIIAPPQAFADAATPPPVAVTRLRDGGPVAADRASVPAPTASGAATPSPAATGIPQRADAAPPLAYPSASTAPRRPAKSATPAFAQPSATATIPVTPAGGSLNPVVANRRSLPDETSTGPDPRLPHETRPPRAIVSPAPQPLTHPASVQADGDRAVTLPAPVKGSTRPIPPARVVAPAATSPSAAPTPPAVVAPDAIARAGRPAAAAQHGVGAPAPAAVLAGRPAPASPTPVPPQPVLPTPDAAPVIRVPAAEAAAIPAGGPSQSAPPAPDHPAAAPAGAQPPMTRLAADSAPTAETSAPAAQISPPPARPAPIPQPAQPAAIVLGVAFGGFIPAPRPLADAQPSPREQALQALTALAGAGPAAPIAAASHAQHGALDMQRQDWPQAMIDRIEALRDAADATSTRITLAPDALGKVDLSIRHDGDTVHVHFSADAAQTRTLLADAQPKLAELAQQRGFRLGQTSVDAGASGGGQRQQPHSAAPPPQRPASAFAPTTAEDAAADPTRLA